MHAEVYAEWLRRQKRRVVRSQSSYWQSEAPGIFQAFPHHWLIEPAESELAELTSAHRALVLRYSMRMPCLPVRGQTAQEKAAGSAEHIDREPFGTEPSGKVPSGREPFSKVPFSKVPASTVPGNTWHECSQGGSYHAVCTAPDYGFESLGAKTRGHTRRSLRECEVAPISFQRYEEEGWDLRVDTLARQQRQLGESREDWKIRARAAGDLEGFEVWAAQVEGRLAATVLLLSIDDWYYLLYQQCHRAYLSQRANNALTFVVTRTLMARPGVKGIYFGMRSLDAPASVDEFKFHMGYERRVVRERIVLHPALARLANPCSQSLLRLARKLSPGQRWLAKAEALLRLSIAEKNANASAAKMAGRRMLL